MVKGKKRICIFQMHYTDIGKSLKDYNAVEKIKESNIFDDVVIAAADLPENRLLEEYAAYWGIDIYYGSVTNVTERINKIVNQLSAVTILRALVQWFFVDVALVKKIVGQLESTRSDYLRLPSDFDIRFGGDVFSRKFISEMNALLKKDPSLLQKYSFNPWGYADLYGDDLGLNIIEFKDVPVYDNLQFKRFKAIYNSIWPEHWDTADSPQYPYEVASEYIVPMKSRVLDIACGFGTGAKYLSDNGPREIVGVDVSQEVVEHCLSKYEDVENLTFICGDALEIEFNDTYFDVIVSIHTMEHVLDDNLFLQKLRKWLKRKGTIVLEAPLLMKYPFINSNEPFGDAHIREYFTRDLLDLFSKHFKIRESYGVCRGYYTNLNKARNAVMLVGEKEA